MGCTSEIRISFQRERHARWAYHVARDMICMLYAPDTYAWVGKAEECYCLSRRYLRFRQEIAAMNTTGWDRDSSCALHWLERCGRDLRIARCADIARFTGVECEGDFFPQLCFAIALRFPQVPFTAVYRHEMTVSGAIQRIRMRYDGARMYAQTLSGERPMDEDDWESVPVLVFAAEGGQFRRLQSEPIIS